LLLEAIAFQFEAYCFNHYATVCPKNILYIVKIIDMQYNLHSAFTEENGPLIMAQNPPIMPSLLSFSVPPCLAAHKF
jgi:hypothetical protein